MATKVNPTIFKIGYTNNWHSKYIEKKYNEIPLNNFSDLEIRKFINKFFKDHGLIVETCKLFHSVESLNIFISYYKTNKAFSLIKKKRKELKISWKDFKRVKFRSKKRRIKAKKKNEITTLKYEKNLRALYKNREFQNIISTNRRKEFVGDGLVLINKKFNAKLRRKKMASYAKDILSQIQFKSYTDITYNSFLEKLTGGIKLFTNKKIKLVMKQINLHVKTNFFNSYEKKGHLAATLRKLDKFKKNKFFKKGINILLLCLLKKEVNTANLLANYIAEQFRELKKHSFFLKFLRKTLDIFMEHYSKEIKGIFIKIKGRFNGSRRARKRVINIGMNIPILTLKSDINYKETIAFNKNGTFGIKVFLYKPKKKISKKKINEEKSIFQQNHLKET